MKNFSNVEVCDLEALVAEQIPDYKEFGEDHKYRIKCPHCPNDKKPALSVLRNLKVGICFRCNKLFLTNKEENILDKLENIEDLFELNDYNLKNSLDLINDSIFSLFSDVSKNNDFLNTRNPFVKDWNYYGIKEGVNEVITPYYMFGKMVFFQIRRYNPRGFYNPKNIQAPLFIPSDVNKNPGLWYSDVPTVLVEGPFDSIMYDCIRKFTGKKFNIAALGGKVMTQYRANLLKQLGVEDIIINLDESILSWNLRDEMRNDFNFKNKIIIIPSDGDDPEEVGRRMGLEKFSEFVIPYIFDYKPKSKVYNNLKQISCLDMGKFKINFRE